MRRQNQSQNEQSDDDCTSSASQILERVQPDRVTVTKPEEDRRRRTIIVEKKNGTYGFTLQSYGIHYKKEQEIEMITYVDYVDYDGPAYRSGMREGDVILSINGTDMEKADHKTLVNFIKSCDTRMRMVVLFEDCVRKVELHIRYIQLQRILQNKMIELEKVCIKERQLLEGKWKTHSLPARKKYQNETPSSHVTYSYCRPTVSTEDVAKQQQNQQHKNQLILTYRYLEPNYYMLQPTTSSSEYLLTFDDGKSSEHHLIVKTPSDLPKKISKGNQTTNNSMIEKKKLSCNYGGNLCNPCVQSNSDNTSLEAYDLASSPCCDPRCVPTTFNQRRRNNSSKNKNRRDSKCEETQTDIEQTRIKTRPHSQASQTSPIYNSSVPKRYFHIGAGLMSQCSLHSCTSSELSCVAPTTIGESTGSYTTSLSTDTLYWNGSCDSSSRHKMKDIRYSQPPTNEPIYVQYNSVNPPIKPKSWDNLATKAFGGYGFGGGYGYIDSSGKTSKSGSIRSNSSVKNTQYVRTNNTTEKNIHPPQNIQQKTRYYTNKSTESLLNFPKYQESNSCECLNPISPIKIDNAEARFFQSPRDNVVSPTDPNFGYYSVRKQKQISTSSEATRL